MKGRSLLALALLCSTCLAQAPSPPQAGWSQAGGGPGRAGVAALPAVLDVVDHVDLAPEGWEPLKPRSQVYETPFGLASLVQSGADANRACSLALAFRDGPARLHGQPFACPEPAYISPFFQPTTLAGYDAARQWLVLCDATEADAATASLPGPGIHFISAATGVPAWQPATPVVWDVPTVPGQVPPDLSAVPEPPAAWTCSSAAIDSEAGLVYASLVRMAGDQSAAAAGSTHRLVALDVVEQEVRWAVPAMASPVEQDSSSVFLPTSLTKTTTGLVVLGEQTGAGAQTTVSAISGEAIAFGQYDLDGRFLGGRIGVLDAALSTATASGVHVPRYSTRMAAHGRQAAVLFDDMVILVDPRVTDQGARALPESPYTPLIAPVGPSLWSPDHLVVLLDYFIAVLDASSAGSSRLLDYDAIYVVDGVLDDHGTGHFLFQVPTTLAVGPTNENNGTRDPLRPVLVSFDLATGKRVQRLFPDLVGWGGYQSQAAPGVALTMLADGLLVTGGSRGAIVGEAAEAQRPQVALSARYPPLGEPVTIDLAAEDSGTTLVAWGDGRLAEFGPGQVVQGVYGTAGDYEVRVKRVNEDGTTATATALVHPGRQPPSDLNFLQRRFAAENQEVTFFVLGLAITLLGALLAVLQRRRHHSRIHAELAVLDAIAQQGRDDPVEARRDLDDFERLLRGRLAKGELRDTQYDILDRRARDVRRDLMDHRAAPELGGLAGTRARDTYPKASR